MIVVFGKIRVVLVEKNIILNFTAVNFSVNRREIIITAGVITRILIRKLRRIVIIIKRCC